MATVTFRLTADGSHDVSGEARDERGRWTGGGDGAGAKGTEKSTAVAGGTGAAFEADLKARGIPADLTGLERADLDGMQAAFDRVYQEYPQLQDHGLTVSTGLSPGVDATAASLVGAGPNPTHDAFAVTGNFPTGPAVVLNPSPRIWSDAGGDGKMSILTGHDAGFGVPRNPGEVLTHELGHAVADTWRNGPQEFYDMVGQAQDAVFKGNYAKIGDTLSSYAMPNTNGRNLPEFFGEVFAANNSPGWLAETAKDPGRPSNAADLIQGFAKELNSITGADQKAHGLPVQKVI